MWVYLGDKSERYVLGQPGEKNLLVLGVNPSSAEPGADDPTIRMVREISRKEGYDGWIMVNLHPQRAPKPNQLIEKELWRENNLKALDAVRRSFRIDKVWCAWGASIDKPGNRFLYRSLKEIHELLKDGVSWMRYGDLTKNGHPHHPLYSSSEGKFLPFDVEGYLSNHG